MSCMVGVLFVGTCVFAGYLIEHTRRKFQPEATHADMKTYYITFSNVAHFITYEIAGDGMEYAEGVARRIAAKLNNGDGLAQEEYDMQTGDEPQHYEREEWTYTLDLVEEGGTVEGEAARTLRKATRLLDLDLLQADAGGNG